MPKECDLALQNIIPLSKQPFKTQTRIENEDVRWSPQYNMPTTRTNRHRALSLREVELDDLFLILHIVLETCTIEFMHQFTVSFVSHFYILRLTSWIWTSPSTQRLKFESPSNWNSYEGFDLEHCWGVTKHCMMSHGLVSCPNHTNFSVRFHPRNCWELCWEIDVNPSLFTLLQSEMPMDGAISG